MHKVTSFNAEIPALGMGTYTINGNRGAQLIAKALGMGYAYLDSAQMYDNEADVGKGVKLSGQPREDVFVLTKVHPENIGKKDFLNSVEESLRKLSLDHVDLLLIHWPNPNVPVVESVGELIKAKERGYTRFIGVSNFNIAQINAALATGAEIVTNQVEFHCLIDQRKVHEFLRGKGISMTAYSPLGQGRLLGHPMLASLAKKYDRSQAQIALRWLVAHDGVIAIPRSSNENRLTENLGIFEFELSEQDMKALGSLSTPSQRFVDWYYSPQWD